MFAWLTSLNVHEQLLSQQLAPNQNQVGFPYHFFNWQTLSDFSPIRFLLSSRRLCAYTALFAARVTWLHSEMDSGIAMNQNYQTGSRDMKTTRRASRHCIFAYHCKHITITYYYVR